MIEFQPATEEEREAYGNKFDCSMFFDTQDLRAIQLAARARIASRQSAGKPVYEFDRGVVGLWPDVNNMMMNPTYVGLYWKLLENYVMTDSYVSVTDDEGLGFTACRDRAEEVARDLTTAYEVYGITQQTDFDAFSDEISASLVPQWTNKDRGTLHIAGINGRNLPLPVPPEIVAFEQQCKTVGKFLYNFLKT